MVFKYIIIALIAIIQIPSTISENVLAEDERPEVINFVQDNSTGIASVEPGKQSPFLIKGYIDGTVLDFYNVTRAIFELDVFLSPNWTVIVEPKIIEVNDTERKNFSVTIFVPENTSYYIIGSLSLSFIITEFPENITYKTGPMTGTIQVLQFYYLETTIIDKRKNLVQGEKDLFNIDVKNLGNGRDTVELKIDNYQDLIDNGIEVNWNSSIDIDDRSTQRFLLDVKTSKDTAPGKYVIRCIIHSEQEEVLEGITDDHYVNLTIIIKRDYTTPYYIIGTAMILIVAGIIMLKLKRGSGRAN